MKNLTLKTAISTSLIALALGTATTAFADDAAEDAAELQQFITANPELQSAIDKIEKETGGKVVDADFEDDAGQTHLVEIDVLNANGTKSKLVYNTTDQSYVADTH